MSLELRDASRSVRLLTERMKNPAARDYHISGINTTAWLDSDRASTYRNRVNEYLSGVAWFPPSNDADGVEIKVRVDKFICAVYELNQRKCATVGIDFVFARLNTWLLNEDLSTVDAVLASIDVGQLNADLVLSFLTITSAAEGKLKYRAEYYGKARKRIRKLYGWFEARRILAGLQFA